MINRNDTLISEETLHQGVMILGEIDADLRRITKKLGDPPLWVRPTGFDTLVQIILEQQVSLASSQAVYNRLTKNIDKLTPAVMLRFKDEELKDFGFSRQKSGYCRGMATVILDGNLRLEELEGKSDTEVRSELQNLKGIGIWSADIYLLMALRRPNVLPESDLALYIAMQEIKSLPQKPTPEEFQNLGKLWKPWRSVGARILWQYYLNRKQF